MLEQGNNMNTHKKVLGLVLVIVFAAISLAAQREGAQTVTITGSEHPKLTWIASVTMTIPIPPNSGYKVYRAVGACPAKGEANGIPLTPNNKLIQTTTYTDTAAGVGTWCYYVKTIQNGVYSGPSNDVTTVVP